MNNSQSGLELEANSPRDGENVIVSHPMSSKGKRTRKQLTATSEIHNKPSILK